MDRAPPRRNRGGSGSPAGPSGRGGRRRRTPRPPPTPTPTSTPPRPPRRPKNRSRRRPPPLPTVALKLVVRRLPPALTDAQFAIIADPRGASKAIWRSYMQGSLSEPPGSVKRAPIINRHSVAYLGFATVEDAAAFAHAFHAFKIPDPRPGANAEFVARVERALFQNTPPPVRRKSPPPIQGTIESDPDYIAFVENLQTERNEATRVGIPSVAQTAALFESKSASQNATADVSDKHSPSVHLDDRSRRKPPNGSSVVLTPLMEDVRARRRERDHKKKFTKTSIRPARLKGRQITVVDPKASPDGGSKNARKKKRRGANEPSTPVRSKRIDDVASPPTPADKNSTQRVGTPNGRRPTSILRRDDADMNGRKNGTMPVKASPSRENGVLGAADGSGGSRVGTGRPRSGRRGRGKDKSNVAMNGQISSPVRKDQQIGSEVTHGSVRLLKKETSNGTKT